MITSIGIKGILNHHCAVYIHGSGNFRCQSLVDFVFCKIKFYSDVLDGKRLPLPNQTTFKILIEGILKTIVVYAILLIIVHMDR